MSISPRNSNGTRPSVASYESSLALISRSEQNAILKEAEKQEAIFDEIPHQRKRKVVKRKVIRRKKPRRLQTRVFPLYNLIDPSILHSQDGERGQSAPEKRPTPSFIYPSEIPPECMDPDFYIPPVKTRKSTFYHEIGLQKKQMEEEAKRRSVYMRFDATPPPKPDLRKVSFSSSLSQIPNYSLLFERAGWEGDFDSLSNIEEETEHVIPERKEPSTYKSIFIWKSKVPSLREMIKAAREPAPKFRRTVDWKYMFFKTNFTPLFNSSPELFMNRIFSSLEISEAKSSIIIAPFPKLSRGSRQIIYFALRPGREETVEPVGIMKLILMMMDTIPLVTEVRYRGYLFIVNVDGLSSKNLAINEHSLRYVDFFSYLRKTTGPDPPIIVCVSFRETPMFDMNIASELSMCIDPVVGSWPVLFLKSVESLHQTLLKPRLLPKELGGSLQSVEVMYDRLMARVEEMVPLWTYLQLRDLEGDGNDPVEVDEEEVLGRNYEKFLEETKIINHFLDVKRSTMDSSSPLKQKELPPNNRRRRRTFSPKLMKDWEYGEGGELSSNSASAGSSSTTASRTSTVLSNLD